MISRWVLLSNAKCRIPTPTRRVIHTATSLSSPPPPPPTSTPQTTHYKITLRRSAISLGSRIQDTLVSLGIHRRFQTVYHRHGAEVAGKILKVKELVEVENEEQGDLDRGLLFKIVNFEVVGVLLYT
ncbi:hypothetical protein F5890DRAFT_470759 [Lentinula detonsa]|uniref:Large ribosomal subunit protein uL30-like ferredoxin-like fold domain-containing protein n=1 Tax=Lentinula detonsa TaxID=2804962 RepID=A0AA38UXR7_9AGAR|nr:hypothetical protein F5890DRAFT_470759 [Lentinula detonsa]